jgi:CrcB protein
LNVSFPSFLAVGAGAAVGAWLRWWLGIVLNAVFPAIPLGTLAANLIAALTIGILMGAFAHVFEVSTEVRLLVVTGFLGGLSTFSTFSAEIASLLLHKEPGWAAAAVAAHVIGSVTMTVLGMLVVRALIVTEVT